MTPISFSPWSMFLEANIVVQIVMVILSFGCLLSWTICIAKSIELFIVHRNLYTEQVILQKSGKLEAEHIQNKKCVVGAMIMAVLDEYQSSKGITHDLTGLKERIAMTLERVEASEGRRLLKGTGLLATIGATAPFVGLFGTVWGIMNSFTGIVAAKATSLTVVAPGIAEALLATALGLVTAIPAVILYNIFSRNIMHCRAHIADLSTLIMRIVSRDVSQMTAQQGKGQVIQFGLRAAGE
ncbi:tonB-system energizer ExbB [Commensalibacter papalotli (ex Servin-Garciduenas et al. 2014)]|uniref:Biopolymer transport protein ExbB n=1 Tax=Commensalibacter papalotli (ex Servin-Garciduenas et al. 2014) TaxID=1208583 RepID=W7DWC2_9PROT|nr:tonB-system energizer ExbB [Commensalibacter papalotli (ex Servin-Garciduenas et al. 2014)]EUK19380.1 ExbB/TolQ/MotA [Commensalibacter papalotli (ex Servin-Garciduenas et al. 2014)]